ncbi:MAG: hypothetical protein ACLGIV_06680 [Actinomycetes bacterium]
MVLTSFRPSLVGALLVVLVSALAGCGQPDSTAAADDAPDGRSTPSPECLEVSDDVLRQIAVGAEQGVTFEPTAGAAVRAGDQVYVVAVRFQDESQQEQVGVWTTVALDGVVAPLLVADEVSSAYTTWMSIQDFPQYGVPLGSPLITAARDCLDA